MGNSRERFAVQVVSEPRIARSARVVVAAHALCHPEVAKLVRETRQSTVRDSTSANLKLIVMAGEQCLRGLKHTSGTQAGLELLQSLSPAAKKYLWLAVGDTYVRCAWLGGVGWGASGAAEYLGGLNRFGRDYGVHLQPLSTIEQLEQLARLSRRHINENLVPKGGWAALVRFTQTSWFTRMGGLNHTQLAQLVEYFLPERLVRSLRG